MPLTDAVIRKIKPKAKPFKLADSGGLFLLVQPSGGKWWRYKYRFGSKEKLLALGSYPEISLAEARELHLQARKLVAAGKDPGEAKRAEKQQRVLKGEHTFEVIALEWHGQNQHEWTPAYAKTILFRLNRHIFPTLRKRPVADINAPEVLATLRVIEKSGALDLAQRISQVCGQIFMYAIATGRAERNPVPDLRGALKAPVRKNRAYLTAAELPEYLQKLAVYGGGLQTQLALKLLLLTFVRTVELRGARWSEIDFDKAEWRIPAERMKMKELHIVPLSQQTLSLLRELQNFTGNWPFLFPHRTKTEKFMSENTMLYALHDLGYKFKATCHGFRATASTILNEQGFSPDVIERQLAHSPRNKIRAAYNHAQYLPERRRMMQWWADYIDEAAQKEVKQGS